MEEALGNEISRNVFLKRQGMINRAQGFEKCKLDGMGGSCLCHPAGQEGDGVGDEGSNLVQHWVKSPAALAC